MFETIRLSTIIEYEIRVWDYIADSMSKCGKKGYQFQWNILFEDEN